MTAPGRLRGASNTANGPMAPRSMSWNEYQALNKRGVTDEQMLKEGFTIPKAPVLQKMSWDEYNQLRDNGLSEVQIRLQGYEIPKDPRGFWAKGRDHVLRPGVQGLTLGFSDELRALPYLLPGGETYTQVRDKEQAALARARLDAPKTAMASEFIGSLLAPGAAFGKVAKGVGYGAKILKGAAIGGGSGLLHGIGTSDVDKVGVGGVLKQGLLEGGLGLGLGATVGAAPYVVRGLTGATTQANKLMKARQNLLQSLERAGEKTDDVYARAADQARAARVAEEAREAARVANKPDPDLPPDLNLPPDGGGGEGGGLVLDALGGPGGANVLQRLGPLNDDIAEKLATEARLHPEHPLAQAMRRASRQEKGGIERPVIPSEIGVLASIFGAGVRRARRNEAGTLVNHLLQPLDDAALQAILPRKSLLPPIESVLLKAERGAADAARTRAEAKVGRLAEARRQAVLKAKFKAANAADVETARVAKLAEKEAALEGSAMDYNKKLDVKAAEAADRAAQEEAALIGNAMDRNKVIDVKAANAATRAANVETARVAKLAEQETARVAKLAEQEAALEVKAANAAARAAEKMEVIKGRALTENLPEGARLNATKFVTSNKPKPTSEEGSLVPSLRFGERPEGPVPYFPDPPPDGGGGAAVVPLPRPVVPSSPSVVTPRPLGLVAQAKARAADNQRARQQAPRGDVGANEMLIPLPKPSQTLPGAIDEVLIPGSTEADHVARLQALSPEHFDAHPNTIRQYLEMGDGTGKPTVAQNNVMHQLKKAAYQAEEFAKEEAANQVPELTGLTRYWNNLPPQDHAGNAQKAVASLKEDGLEVTPKSMNARLKALGLILDPKSSGTARTTGTGPPAQSKTLGEAAEKAKVTRRDGSDVSGRVGPSAFPDPTMAATQMMSSMSGGIGGGAYGATQGDTPRERLRNMLLYGVAGATGGAVAPKMVRSMVKMAGNEIGTLGPRARAIADGLSTPGEVVRPPASGYFKKPEAGHTKSTSMPSPGKIRQRLSDAEGHVTWLEQNAQEPFKRTWENVFSPEGFDPTFRMKQGINTMPEAQGKPNPLIDELMGLPRFEALHKRQAALGLPRGGLEWYNLKPIANSYDDMPGNFIFEDFSQAGSAGSVQRGVPMEISNASILLFAKRNGITPKEAVKVMMKQYPMSQGTGLMSVHGTLFDKYQTTGAINPSSPTAGTRKVAGFSRGKLGESVDPSTPGPSRVALDTHDQKATLFPLGLEGYMDKLTAKEYDQIGQNYKRLASQMGLPDETTFQAGRWIGGGPMTGLRSPSGDYMETLAGMLLETARKTGKDTSPAGLRKLWRDVAQGNDFLLPYYGKGPPGR